MKIVITGAAGRLGRRLVELLAPEHEVTGTASGSDDFPRLDVTDFAAARALIGEVKPHIVLHTAAWTDVDGCARDPQRAVQVNGFGAQNIALAAAEAGAAVLYVSSNEVFDGRLSRPYREYDPTHPINPYGYSKWVGEQAILHLNPRHYIVRTSWLFAHGGKNFIQSILAAAQAGKPLRVVTNEIANPTYTDDLAEGIARLIQTGRYGIYHLVNEGWCSRYDFARYTLDHAGYGSTPIVRISAAEWPRPSTPPEFSPLENWAARSLGIALRPWREAVTAFLAREGLLQPDRPRAS